ncbi:hypothetical protein FRC00_001212 [Tulasnella sp. 408]|nr:hypothetical protein FRC00_001212 [Tulasnella sp. 408]
MPKPGKSSASSGTRKKHAKRAAAKGQEDDEPVEQLPPEPRGKKGKKADKKAPRPKVYIPPVKPVAPRRDPLDFRGLASQLPADLVVVLRLLGKKDAVTKGKALDELQAGWIEKAKQETAAEDEETENVLAALETMLPVWFHHYPVLALHSSRRVRLAATQLQASLWSIPRLQQSLRFYLNETAGTTEVEQNLGAWCMAAFDVDRMVSMRAKPSWDNFVKSQSAPSEGISSAPTSTIPSVASFIQLALIAPNTVHQSLNPPAPEAPAIISRSQKSGKSTPRVVTKPAPKSSAEPDPDEEKEADRNARYRVGALGALTWLLDYVQLPDSPPPAPVESDAEAEPHLPDPLTGVVDNVFDMLHDPSFWSCLYSGTRPPWMEAEADVARRGAFGTGQPAVRKSAWALIPVLVRKWGAYPSSWMLADPTYRPANKGKERHTGAAESSGDESEVDDEQQASSGPKVNIAYTEFLDFLKLGCGGSPVQGYPVVLVALSTIPEEILPLTKDALANFFSSLWAAVDGRALSTLDKSGTATAFIASLFECTVYIVGRIQRAQNTGESGVADLARELARQQVAEAWDAVESGRLVIKEEDAGGRLAQFLVRLGKVHVGLSKAAAEPMCSETFKHVSETSDQTRALTWKDVDILAAFAAALPPDEAGLKNAVKETVDSVIKWSSDRLKTQDSGPDSTFTDVVDLLSRIIRKFGPVLNQDISENSDLETTVFSSIDYVVRTLPPNSSVDFLLSSLNIWTGTEKRERLWGQVLGVIGSPECPKQQSTVVLSKLLEPRKEALPSCGGSGGLTSLVESLLKSVLTVGDTESSTLLGRTLAVSEHFIPLSVAQGSVERAASAAVQAIPPLLHQDAQSPASLRGTLQTLSPLFATKSSLIEGLTTLADLMVNVLVLAYMLSLVEDGDDTLDECVLVARTISKSWAQMSCPGQSRVREGFLNLAHSTMQDVRARLESTTVVDALSAPDLLEMLQVATFDADVVLPPLSTFESLHSTADLGYIDTPLALFDPAIKQTPGPVTYDRDGLSEYGRVLAALLEIFKWDRQVLSRHPEMIGYLLLLECAAEDLTLDPEEPNAIFGPAVDRTFVASLEEDISMAITYVFSSAVASLSPNWHQQICSSLKTNAPAPDDEILSRVVRKAFHGATNTETKGVRDLRIFRKVLAHVFKTGDITAAEAEQWILLSDSIRKQAPQASLSITLTIAQAGAECKRLDRLRNELASNLSGIPPHRASTEGLRLLRHLVASAPLPDSEGVYLPSQRAVFLLQALQKWVASDEELDEEIDSLLVQLCTGLAPILLTVPGSHWDFIFDLMESNLEVTHTILVAE